MNPQQAQAMLDKLYQDVCDGIEKQLQADECLELREGDHGLGHDDLCEIANIMSHRGYSSQVFRMTNDQGKNMLVLGRAPPRV